MATSELDLVNNVDLRLALTESEAQLEQTLTQLLTPLLLKLASQDPQVRQAVFKVIQNVFPRITAAPALQLPVEALLAQIKEPKIAAKIDGSTVRLYSLLFLSKGVERLTPEQKCKLVPEIIKNISLLPANATPRMFSVLVKLLENWKAPTRESPEFENMHKTLGFDVNANDESFLANKIGKFLMLQPNSTPAPMPLPGLSLSDCSFFTKDAGITYSNSQDLNTAKVRVLEFLKAGFSDQNLVLPLLVASVDSSSTIADAAETRYRKLTIDYNDNKLIDSLVDLYLGTQCPAVKPTLQDKILGLLLKCNVEMFASTATQIAELGLSSEHNRLRLSAVRFIKRTTREQQSSEIDQEHHCSQIASKLKMNILSDGWPQLDSTKVSDFHKAVKQRELQYETLGDLLCSSSKFLENNLDYFLFLFESLESETAELRSVLQIVLSRLTMYLPKLLKESKEALRPIFRSIIINETSHSATKFLALKFVNMAYPFSDVDARFLCVLGTNSNFTSEAVEEARKGLDPYQYSLIAANLLAFEATQPEAFSTSIKMPTFDDYLSLLMHELDSALISSRKQIQSCMKEAILFAFRILIMHSIESHKTVIAVDEHWQTRLDEAMETDPVVKDLVASEIDRLSRTDYQMTGDDAPKNQLQNFVDLVLSSLKDHFVTSQAIAPNSVISSVLYSVIKVCPDNIIASLRPHLTDILQILLQTSQFTESLRKLAKCHAIIGTHCDVTADYITEVQSAFGEMNGLVNRKEVALYVVSVFFSRLALRNRLNELELDYVFAFLENLIELVKIPQLYDPCLLSVSELAIFGVMGPTINDSERLIAIQKALFDAILPRAKACHELSLLSLTKLSLASKELYESNFNEALPIEDLVFGTHIAKNIEFAFVGGECLLILAGGWQSKYLKQSLDIQGSSLELVPLATGRCTFVLSEILRFAKMSKPALRKASCLWLLAIVQYLGHLPEIKNRAAEVHFAFMSFLLERDEIVQECASRGLGLTYELGNAELKETLVKGLIKSFTDPSGSTALTSGSVGADTQLFDNDILRTHDGSISTYKDVLSLASDVGDPSLVYKFMSLAKANASWTSRRGMAFGLGKVLSKSSLETLLANDSRLILRLIPKLFRYRFDPNKLVSQSMNDIWSALFPESSTTINNNFESILNEVLKGMGNREWRTRQASISAMESLLQIQAYTKYEQHLQEIWNMTFRCMDDIKDTVRKEGQTLAKTLARILIRNTDPSSGNATASQSKKIIEQVIPFLLGGKALLSDAEEVKHFALDTILKLCDTAGDSIKSFIPTLITTFVELMSSLEPEIVNYLVLNADKYNLSGNEVDAKRIQSLGSSPLLEAIDKLIGHVDESLMDELVSKLKSTIKKSVGLPSKACGSRVIVMLVTKMPVLSKPYGDKLLGICLANLKDRNLAISTSFAISAGYCCKLTSVEGIVNYSAELTNLYFANKDAKSRLIAAQASNSVSKFAGYDKFEAVASAFLPLAFIGKHDEDKDVQKLFESEWIECASGNSAIKLYFNEIRSLIELQIKCNDYSIRRLIARTLIDMASLIDNYSEKETEALFEILLYGCKDKSWVGKELVFDALIKFSTKNVAKLNNNSELMDAVLKTVTTEVKRRNKTYQVCAIQSMSSFIREFPQFLELITQYVDIMGAVLDDDYLEEVDLLDENRKGEKSLKSQHAVKIEEVYIGLLKNIGTSISPHAVNLDLLKFLLQSMKKFANSGHELSWRTCIGFNEIVKSDLEPLSKLDLDSAALSVVSEFFELLFSFKEEYRLDRALTLLARNSAWGIRLFKKYSLVVFCESIQLQLELIREQGQSSVVTAEIDKALKELI